MDTACFKACTYDNYIRFNEAIRELAEFFSDYAGHIDVLDAHSFAWVLGGYVEAKWYIFDEEGEPKETQLDSGKKETTAQVRVRLRQSEFRKNLIEYWDGKCAVTGCRLTDVLIASHVKPWRACKSHNESVSKYNGLLLTPNMDRLFDEGYISFDDDGKMLISSSIVDGYLESLGLKRDMQLRKIEKGHQSFLAYHRSEIFRKNG